MADQLLWRREREGNLIRKVFWCTPISAFQKTYFWIYRHQVVEKTKKVLPGKFYGAHGAFRGSK